MEDMSYAFVVSGADIKVLPLATNRARVREQAGQLLAPFRQLRAGDMDLTRLTYDTRAAYALYQAIFAPVRSALGPATDILIVPDDVLHVVPFEALVESAAARRGARRRAGCRVRRGGVPHPALRNQLPDVIGGIAECRGCARAGRRAAAALRARESHGQRDGSARARARRSA